MQLLVAGASQHVLRVAPDSMLSRGGKEATCKTAGIIMHLGGSLVVGSILVRAFRLARIFNARKFTVVKLQDSTLLEWLAAMCVAAATPQVVQSAASSASLVRGKCLVSQSWGTAASACVQGLLLVASLGTVLRTRHAPAAFSGSKSILVATYNIVLMVVVFGLLLSGVIDIQPQDQAVLLAVATCCTVLTTCLLFFVPILRVARKAFRLLSSQTSKMSAGAKRGSSTMGSPKSPNSRGSLRKLRKGKADAGESPSLSDCELNMSIPNDLIAAKQAQQRAYLAYHKQLRVVRKAYKELAVVHDAVLVAQATFMSKYEQNLHRLGEAEKQEMSQTDLVPVRTLVVPDLLTDPNDLLMSLNVSGGSTGGGGGGNMSQWASPHNDNRNDQREQQNQGDGDSHGNANKDTNDDDKLSDLPNSPARKPASRKANSLEEKKSVRQQARRKMTGSSTSSSYQTLSMDPA